MPDARTYQDALRLMALVHDERMMPSDHVCDDLFERGLVTNHRDICDEYHAELTPAGREFICDALMADHQATDVEQSAPERVAPVQDIRGASVPMGTIPWGLHEVLWLVYADHGHGNQSAERLAERGGFSRAELGMLAVGTYGARPTPAEGRRIPLLDLWHLAQGLSPSKTPERT